MASLPSPDRLRAARSDAVRRKNAGWIQQPPPAITGHDLRKWRVERRLSRIDLADLFGFTTQRQLWVYEEAQPDKTIPPYIARILQLVDRHSEDKAAIRSDKQEIRRLNRQLANAQTMLIQCCPKVAVRITRWLKRQLAQHLAKGGRIGIY